MSYTPPTKEEKELVEECYAIQYPTDNTWPLTVDSAKRGILANIRSDWTPAAQDNGEWKRHCDYFGGR